MMAQPKRAVLITGCSDGGTGAALAKEFHAAGLQVYATARDTSKMKTLTATGIETLALDIQSEASIEACAQKIPGLDLLINNAGASYIMPIADLSLAEAKKLFDTNVWGHIAVIQSFLPLLMKSTSSPMIVNHTSAGVVATIPFQSVYNASKAAFSRFSDTLRLELQPFDISVVELRTGGVQTSIAKNVQAKDPKLPEDSIYAPAREIMQSALRNEWFENMGISPEQWATEVVMDLLKKNPSPVIWRGESARSAWFGSLLPSRWFDGMFKRMTGLDKVESIIRKQ